MNIESLTSSNGFLHTPKVLALREVLAFAVNDKSVRVALSSQMQLSGGFPTQHLITHMGNLGDLGREI
jgi:hypothetical protein